MAIVEVVEYLGPDPHEVFAWKYANAADPSRSDELGTWTQLVVREAQEAILFKNGQALDLYGPGRHTLSTNNIPLLNRLINLPFGGESPFKAEVWFINKVHSLDVKWGTSDPIQLQDPSYRIFIPVRSHGQFGVRIEDSRKFLVKLVGAVPSFDKSTLQRFFRGVLLTKVKDLISTYLIKKDISILQVNAYLDEISEHMKQRVGGIFADYGIEAVNFFVNSINVPEEDPAVQELKKALAERAKMEIMGTPTSRCEPLTRSRPPQETKEAVRGSSGPDSEPDSASDSAALSAPRAGQMAGQLQTGGGSVFCARCRTHNPPGAQFCLTCGANILRGEEPPRKAPETPSEVPLCNKCGNPLPRDRASAPPAATPTAPAPNAARTTPSGPRRACSAPHRFPFPAPSAASPSRGP
jgi:membrane protease subunit (stomatin/prohibitin family)